MSKDRTKTTDLAHVGSGVSNHQPVRWRCVWNVDKFDAGAEDVRAGRYVSSTNPIERLGQPIKPYETVAREGNILTYGGADLMWIALTTGLSATPGLKNTVFSSGNAAIIVGTSGSGELATDTDLDSSGDSSRAAAGMEAGYPLHSTGTDSSSNADCAFRAVFTTVMANFVWEEWGITNSTNSTFPIKGRLLNRKAEALGTKTSAATWTFTATLSLS